MYLSKLIMRLSSSGWPFSNTVCKLSGLVQGTSVCASVFTLVAIAVDRSVLITLRAKLNQITTEGEQ